MGVIISTASRKTPLTPGAQSGARVNMIIRASFLVLPSGGNQLPSPTSWLRFDDVFGNLSSVTARWKGEVGWECGLLDNKKDRHVGEQPLVGSSSLKFWAVI